MSARRILAILGAAGAAGLVAAACGSSQRDGFDPSSADASAGGSFDDDGDAAAGDAGQPKAIGWLHGTVFAPEGTVPVANAMVYLTKRTPEPIPDHVYCDTCVHLTPLEPYAYSTSDGTFELAAYTTGTQYLVVQKGQFRRVREVNVAGGDQNVAGDLTRLPGKTDPAAGDTIPKIAMVAGGYDKIGISMKKLGIEEFYRYGDAPFDLGGPPPGTKTGKSANDLMANPSELAGYHIALLPCAAMGANRDENSNTWQCGAPSPAQKTALQGYVDAGGKLYVTDFAYEAVRQTWPGFLTFYDATMNPLTDVSSGVGTACRGGGEDTPGTPQDKGLASWLTAIGDKNIELKASWTRVAKVSPQPGFDEEGKPVTITPKVWMTSSIGGVDLPATVSFQQKCGRVLFSTYHAEGDFSGGLLPQEKALLYILLEVGVCVGDLPPPPPPR